MTTLYDCNNQEVKEGCVLLNIEDGETYFIDVKEYNVFLLDLLETEQAEKKDGNTYLKYYSILRDDNDKCLNIAKYNSIYTVIHGFSCDTLYAKGESEDMYSWKEVKSFYEEVVNTINNHFYTNFKQNVSD